MKDNLISRENTNYQNKTKKDLVTELKELHAAFESLKTSYAKDIAECKQTEKALRESEERYHRLVEGSPGPIAVHSEGKFVYVNPAGAKLIGAKSPQELIGRSILDVVHPDSRSKVVDRLKHLAEGREAPIFEEKFVKFDGSVIDVEVVGIPYSYHGKIATQVVVSDITERKQVEASLKQALEWQEAIFEGSRDAIFISDQDSRFVAVNSAACELTGYSREQLLKMRIPDIHDLPDLDAYRMYHQRIFGGEEILSEAKILHRDSTKIETEFNNRCVSIAGKLYMHTTARNITGRKQVERALLVSETRYRELFNNISSGVAIYEVKDNGNDFIFKDFNRAGEQIDGDRKENIIGKSIYQVRPGIKKFGLLEVFKRVFATGIPEHYPIKFYEDEKLQGWFNNFVYRLPSGEIVAVYDDITTAMQAERELMKLQEAIDTSGEVVFMTDKEGIITFVNRAFTSTYGYAAAEVVGKVTPRILKSGTMAANFYKIFWSTLLSGQKLRNECKNKRKDGRILEIEESANAIFDENKNIIGFLGIQRDITKRKLAEEELKESEARFRSLFENSLIGISATSPDGKLLQANRAFARMYGYENQDMMISEEINVKAFYANPVERKKVIRILHRNGVMVAKEYEMVRRDGSRFFVLVSSSEIRDTEGTLLYYQTTHIDLTERKHAEETIKILARFPSENPDPVLRVDQNGQLLFANEASYKFLTWKLQIGKKIPSVLQKIIEEAQKERVRKIIDTEHNQRIISFTIVPVMEAGYANLYGKDITERKQAEEEIRKSKKILEDLNKHLTDIRENERALISREIHDQIGQSLTALKLDLNWMHKYINTDPEAVTKLEGMIGLVSNTIKDVQRISSDLRPGILDDLGLVSATEWYCGEFEERTGIRCSLRLDDSIFGDSQKNLVFFRVLQETLTNVIRHANASSVSIILHQSKQGTTMTIKDNGIGIIREKIESLKSLGLIGMRERLRQFGGKLDISSGKGQGTKLTIFIPEKKKSV